MTDATKPPKFKLLTRPGNVAAAPTELTEVDRQDMSDEIEKLLDRAQLDLQREVNLTLTMPAVALDKLVVLVMDGTSPLAGLAPPTLASQGARGYVARLLARDKLADLVERFAPSVAAAMREPMACGHLGFLASTARTGVLGATSARRRWR